jgi:hypothetical protein
MFTVFQGDGPRCCRGHRPPGALTAGVSDSRMRHDDFRAFEEMRTNMRTVDDC